MSLLEKAGMVALSIVGIAIWSIDYFIVKAIGAIGTWVAELMGAPAGVGNGITILILVLLLGVMTTVAVAGGVVIWFGMVVGGVVD